MHHATLTGNEVCNLLRKAVFFIAKVWEHGAEIQTWRARVPDLAKRQVKSHIAQDLNSQFSDHMGVELYCEQFLGGLGAFSGKFGSG